MLERLGRAALALALMGTAIAARPAVAARLAPTRARLTYAVNVAGLRTLRFDALFSVDPVRYRIDLLARTVGVAGFFHPGRQLTSAAGTWWGYRAVPEHYLTAANWGGDRTRTEIVYRNGQPEVLQRILPPRVVAPPIPAAMLAGSSNLLSVFAEMIRDAALTGRCAVRVTTYNGRVLTDVVSRTAGNVRIDNPAFKGGALQCDYSSYVLAGLADGAARGELAPPAQSGAIWLGQVLPRFARLPVQFRFATSWFGEVTARLIAIQPVPAGTTVALDPRP